MKLCEFENCKKEATYAFYFNKPILCKEHKKDNMKTKTCICMCGKARPTFGLSLDVRPSCCKNCKTSEMINLIDKNRLCKCGTRPSFGLKNDIKPTCCKECKTDNMINIVSFLCSCGKQPIFGLESDEKPTCCKDCKTLEMIDIKNNKCICGKARPSFGLITDDKPTYCKECKTEEMIDIANKKCICGKSQPNFGLENDKTPTCCKECKTPEMIDITSKKCICGKATPYFGLETDKTPTCCKECKSLEMIDIKNKKCICGKSIGPCFGLEFDTTATCCSFCKTTEMIDLVHQKCICGKSQPIYGLENDKIATCCTKCKTDEMIDLKHEMCKSNYLEEGKTFECNTRGNKKYKGYCTRCYSYHFPNDPLTFQIRCKTKEQAVRDYINENFKGFQHDIPLWIGGCDCTHKRRIDHRKLIGNTLLCIETDENQHKGYDKEDEETRYNDLMMIHGGKLIFIRFNPDKYKEKNINKNPTIATRLIVLKDEIEKQIKRIENEENVELLEEIFLYYDKN
jgi:hypothetical protein